MSRIRLLVCVLRQGMLCRRNGVVLSLVDLGLMAELEMGSTCRAEIGFGRLSLEAKFDPVYYAFVAVFLID